MVSFYYRKRKKDFNMSYSEAMAKHYQDKRKDTNTKHQLKYVNTYFNKNFVTIHSNFKLDRDTLSLVKEIIRKNDNDCDYFIDSPVYSDEFMKERNNKLASAETVDELVAYLDDLDECIEVIKSDNHVEKGLGLEQQVASDGIHLKTYLYI
jgi:predicted unusual protein kinase regulating ubiquinone biosynthesis (AarF/ABC1/UbiB family)